MQDQSAYQIIHGDCLEVLRSSPADVFDFCLTDPPYGLGKAPDMHKVLAAWLAGDTWEATGSGFMGKEWDAFVPGPEVWREVLRVLKPGAHVLCFAGSRTVDVMGLSLRLAGFEIRDQLQWLYGSGFPKSSNLGDGFGTALKPAHEPIILARKPINGTTAANFEAVGTGGLNIDGCRIEAADQDALQAKFFSTRSANPRANDVFGEDPRPRELTNINANPLGRWPANILLDTEAGIILDAQAGNRPGMKSGGKHRADATPGMFGAIDSIDTARGDDGGPSRFFYCPKASRSERNAGLDDFPLLSGGDATGRVDGSAGTQNPRAGTGRAGSSRNPHPTVKPEALLRYLVRLIAPPGGLGLVPFAGSGSEVIACIEEGCGAYGIELDETYVRVARARVAYREKPANDEQLSVELEVGT